MEIEPPLSASDILTGSVVGFVAFLAVLALTRRSPDGKLILGAVAVKLVSCYALCAMMMPIFQGGDIIGFYHHGVIYSRYIADGFTSGSTEYLTTNPFFLPEGQTTLRTRSLSGLAHFLTMNSFVGASVVFAMIGFSGQFLLYRTFTQCYPDPRVQAWWRAGILYMPSVTFWSSGLFKDPVGLWGLGLAVWGAHQLFHRGRMTGLVKLLVGAYCLLLFRTQVVPVLVFALTPQLLGFQARVGPVGRGVAAVVWVARVGLIALAVWSLPQVGTLDKRMDLSRVSTAMFEERAKYRNAIAGSSLLRDDEEIPTESSVVSMLLLWPGAVVTCLFRPFLWEGFRSPIIFAAAAENTVLLVLSVRALGAAFRPTVLFRALRSPMFLTCLIFVCAFAFAIGVATPNLGTISRYRIPLVPFFIGVLGILEYHSLGPVAYGR